jgi:hypothetical protein
MAPSFGERYLRAKFRFIDATAEALYSVLSRPAGVRAQAHLYFSEIFPDTLGQPIFGN